MDTLQIDTTFVSTWRSDDDYNYEREFARTGQSWFDSIRESIGEWLRTLFGADYESIFDIRIWAIIGILIVVVILVYVFMKHPALFFRNKHVKTEYTVSEDTIYGIDFDAVIAKAVGSQDWREAIRFTYLKLLRKLSDAKIIDWQIFKTPTKYTLEYRNADFSTLTNLFIRVRYGGFSATESDYRMMDKLSETAATAAREKDSNRATTSQQATDNKEGGGR